MTTDKIINFQGEVQLLSWSETNTRGRTVTFQLGVDGDSHPFRYAAVKQGKRGGQRFAMVLVEIGDDEKPVEKTPAQMAWLLCKDEQFWFFLNERSFVTVDSEESAKACICEACGVTSRSELDKDPAARNAWLTQFYNPWSAYRATIERAV